MRERELARRGCIGFWLVGCPMNSGDWRLLESQVSRYFVESATGLIGFGAIPLWSISISIKEMGKTGRSAVSRYEVPEDSHNAQTTYTAWKTPMGKLRKCNSLALRSGTSWKSRKREMERKLNVLHTNVRKYWMPPSTIIYVESL